jgi:Ca2+-binding RTX toxin-like protein
MTGGTGIDEFVFGSGKTITGKIDGGSGADNWLDYASYTTAVAVDLTANKATGVDGGVAGGIANIRNVRGGLGSDTLKGNSRGNILIGGPSTDTHNDTITGGSGRSILIGGKGNDAVKGGSGDDIVVGGYTSYDNSSAANDLALEAILGEWTSGDSYSTRITKIKAGVGTMHAKLVSGTTVHDDGNASTLTGGAGTDWFFEGARDKTTDRVVGEQIN